ncbi:hypothetical protein ACQY0O_008012 [Thecaphora frezii]
MAEGFPPLFWTGSGELTLELARRVASPAGATSTAGYVLGVDASADMVLKAGQLAESARREAQAGGLATHFRVLDGHDLESGLEQGVKSSFDKVFSNAALHWMKTSPAQVIRGIASALKPKGIFVAEMGGFLNCVGIRSLLHDSCRRRGVDPEHLDPWFFPTAQHYTKLLEEGGFEVKHCELVPRITELPRSSGVQGWLRTFSGPFLNAFGEEAVRQEVLEEVEEKLRQDCYDAAEDRWSLMYVRLRVVAVRIR